MSFRSPDRLRPQEIESLFEIFSKKKPVPETELIYTNPYTLLVAVILSAQATDKGVNKATKRLFEKIQTPQEMIALGEDNLKNYIKTISFYNVKAKNIIKLSQILIDTYEGEVPRTREALESLPGVGRKTANVILNIVYKEGTIAVDTHIFRVSNRLGLAPGKTPLEVEKNLLKVVPEPYVLYAHHWLILHGRYVCKARRPECFKCCVQSLCKYNFKNL